MTGKTVGVKSVRLLTVLFFFTGSTLAHGAPPSDALQNRISELLTLVEKQSRQIQEQQQAIEEQNQRFSDYRQKMEKDFERQQAAIEELQHRTGVSTASGASAEQPKPTLPPSPPATERFVAKQPSAPKTAGPIQPVGRPPEPAKNQRPPEIASIFDQPGILLPKGSLALEPSLQYSHSSNKRISLHGYTIIPAITIGLIDVLSISRDSYVAALSTRYGLTNLLELELKIPYVYRIEESSTTPYATETSVEDSRIDGNGLGDIEFGLRWQVNQPRIGPFYLAGLKVKTNTGTDPFEASRDPDTLLPTELTTGSGFVGIQGTLSAIFPSDPAVFFGGINYLWNIEREIGTVDGQYYGEIDPGDSYGFNFGMGLSINEKASFSIGYEHNFLAKNKQDGEVIPGQIGLQVGSLQLGYAYRLSDMSNLNLSFSIGVTESAPDVQLTLKIPFTLETGFISKRDAASEDSISDRVGRNTSLPLCKSFL